MKNYIAEAISSLVSKEASWTVGKTYESLEWSVKNTEQKPTKDAVETKAAYLADLDAVQQQRKLAYPSIQDQLDMQYHDAVNGTTTWQDTINAVKAKYPKPEGV